MRITDLPTPALLVDLDVAEANAARMRERARRLGVRLRPHVKTHKTVEAARLQVGGPVGAITVSTLAEARFFGAVGFRDVTWSVPIAPAKLAAVAHLARDLDRLSVLVDSDAAVDALEAAPSGAPDGRWSVFLKVDCGYGRAGVDPRDPASIALAGRLAALPSVDFRGLLTHGGHAYDRVGRAAIREVLAEERDAVVGFATRLRGAGIDVPEVSLGSTPTLSVADEPGDLVGVTEVRPGNYIYFDGFQAAIGSCAPADCALSVLATVIGAHPARGSALLDAGALALSKDVGATHVPGVRSRHGALLDAATDEPLAGLDLYSLSQEHGKLRALQGASDGPEQLRRLRVGDRVRVVANHSCLAAGLHPVHHAVRGGRVVASWTPCRGW